MFSGFPTFMSILNSRGSWWGLLAPVGLGKTDRAEGKAGSASSPPHNTGEPRTVSVLPTLSLWEGGNHMHESSSPDLQPALSEAGLVPTGTWGSGSEWAVRPRAFPPCLHLWVEAGSCLSLLPHRIGTAGLCSCSAIIPYYLYFS